MKVTAALSLRVFTISSVPLQFSFVSSALSSCGSETVIRVISLLILLLEPFVLYQKQQSLTVKFLLHLTYFTRRKMWCTLYVFEKGKSRTFVDIDETIESDNQSQFEDLLHTLNPAGLPPYILSLKNNCPIMLLRNLNPYEGLCNGTRLSCCEYKTHVLSAKIAAGDFKNTHVFIPRITLLSSNDEKLPVQFKRTQFPIRSCFAMTINKAQGQTLDFVGIYLREPVFSHGQLYVALSRAKSSNYVKLLIRLPTPTSDDDHSTCNIVYNKIIEKAIM